MKKNLLFLSLLTAFAAHAQNAHTHTLTFTFTFEASPKSQAQWNEIEEMFAEPFVRSAQGEEGHNIVLEKLGKALDDFPAFCKEQNIKGACYASVNSAGTIPSDTRIND